MIEVGSGIDDELRRRVLDQLASCRTCRIVHRSASWWRLGASGVRWNHRLATRSPHYLKMNAVPYIPLDLVFHKSSAYRLDVRRAPTNRVRVAY